MHEVAIAECTDRPLICLVWQDEHSASLGRMPGCSTAQAGAASRSSNAKCVVEIGFMASRHFGEARARIHY